VAVLPLPPLFYAPPSGIKTCQLVFYRGGGLFKDLEIA
jgi:hypothetical protein